jgi:AraC-like DNA-binding protein
MRCADRGAGVRVPEREWSTARAPEAEQFALWQEAVGQAFVPVSVRRPEAGAFVGGVTVRRLGGVELADIASSAQSVSRTQQQVDRQAGDVYFLNLPLADGVSVGQDGRTARLSLGDFALVDSTRPFELDFGTSFRQVSLKLPRELMQMRLAEPDHVTGVPVRGDRGVGAVAAAAIRAALVSASSLDRRTASALSHHVADLVALALGGVRPQPPSTPGTLLLQAALDEVERRLGDPELSPAAVAERVGISVRYLHRLFAERGPTFGRWVLARRLECAHDDLVDPRQAHWTIARVARRRGFVDPSYFARTFKSRYGISPRELRALAASS